MRWESSRASRNIATSLAEDEDLLEDFVRKAMLFKESNKFNLRQTFIQMCQELMLCPEIFKKYFLAAFCEL